MTPRVDKCGRPEADIRLAQARDYLDLAELALEEKPQAATGNAVLSGIASSDAMCCYRLGERSRGQDHRTAVDLLATTGQGARRMSVDLRRLLDLKDASHYAMVTLGAGTARDAVTRARRLFDAVRAEMGR
jgi:hypothetical protein